MEEEEHKLKLTAIPIEENSDIIEEVIKSNKSIIKKKLLNVYMYALRTGILMISRLKETRQHTKITVVL